MTRLACRYGRYGYRRALNLMVAIDEFTRRCEAIQVARRFRSKEALEVFADLMVEHGVPEHIRSDNVLRPGDSR
jgi:hypothetical protein